MVTDTVTSAFSPVRTPAGGTPDGWGEDGARGRRCDPLPGGSGIMSPGITTGAGSVPWTGTGTAGNARWLVELACDRFGEPASTFPDHTLGRVPGSMA